MKEIAKVATWGYRCENRETTCPQPHIVYRSGIADGFALKGYTFELDEHQEQILSNGGCFSH